ncbi:hypothetical protein N431DRAFT_556622 [Stipitochalara longipes BDJ]|nr:hypothetical protein N431DRAFT_556622 [Stipitochalara longipes BDJ]
MSFAPSFGSVGDFLAIAVLIRDAIIALDDARGSVSEYNQLIRELLSLEHAFLEVGLLCQTPHPTPELIAVSIQIRRIADQCKSCIEMFLAPIYEYTQHFRPGGSGNKFKDALRRLKWKFEKEKIVAFHTEIQMHSAAITLLLQVSNARMLHLDHNIQNHQAVEIQAAGEVVSDRQSNDLTELKAMIGESRTQLADLQTTISIMDNKMERVESTHLGLHHFRSVTFPAMMQELQTLLRAQTRVPQEFEPCLNEKPVLFTDAHGRTHRIHLEWCNSWEAFEATLLGHFRNVPGRKKIMRKEYAFKEHRSQTEIDTSRPYEEFFRPGHRIDMSMIFRRFGIGNVCPACQFKIDQPMDIEIQCPQCDVTFQRIEELVDVESREPQSIVSQHPNMLSTATEANDGGKSRQK